MSNEQFLKDWLHKVWIERDFAAAATAFDPGTLKSNIAGELKMQANDYETMVTMLCRNFDVSHFTLTNVLEIGQEISAVLTVFGERRDTRSPVKIHVHVYRVIENGKFIKSCSSPDYLSFFMAMGQLPEDTLELLLMGVALTD